MRARRSAGALVVLTDGFDTASKLDAAEVSRIASSIDLPVYLLAVVPSIDDPPEPRTADNARSTAIWPIWRAGRAAICSSRPHAGSEQRRRAQIVGELRRAVPDCARAGDEARVAFRRSTRHTARTAPCRHAADMSRGLRATFELMGTGSYLVVIQGGYSPCVSCCSSFRSSCSGPGQRPARRRSSCAARWARSTRRSQGSPRSSKRRRSGPRRTKRGSRKSIRRPTRPASRPAPRSPRRTPPRRDAAKADAHAAAVEAANKKLIYEVVLSED